MSHWFACLDHEQVVERWSRIRELLEPAAPKADGEMEVDDFLHLSEDGLAYIAVMGIGEDIVLVVAMTVITFPRKKVLNIVGIGGAHTRLFVDNYMSVLISFARDIGADCLQASCRDAEARLFLHAGSKAGLTAYRPYSVYRMGV